MTSILKKQLTMLGCALVLAGALAWNSSALHAMSVEKEIARSRYILELPLPRTKLTAEQATRSFIDLLQFFNRAPYSGIDPTPAMLSSFSRQSDMDTLVALYPELARQWIQPQQRVKVETEGEHNAALSVETELGPRSRSFVLVQEKGSWCVDMVATYAKWNGLEGNRKTEAIARLTKLYRGPKKEEPCEANLKQIALCVAQYADDYDGKYPLAKSWVDILQPYIRSYELFKCPSITNAKGSGYAYNIKLSGQLRRAIPNSSQAVLVYETTILKRSAFGVGENIAFRHAGGANYAFADGHVKWFDKSKIPSFKPKS